ncbi:MAG: siderophore-interacting protein [Nocardioides sp.]|nr:siderophore-interacting protein [Nocardioides sp.]
MARQNYTRLGRRPERVELLIPRVLRSERVSPTYQRVTLAGADLSRLDPLGFDQWVRLFIPAPGGADHLQRVPARLTPAAYVRFKAIARTERPLIRSYTIRALRRDDDRTEIDIDVVLHPGPDGDLAPAAAWAATCRPGDPVALLDAGTGFDPPPGVRHVRLVGDETAVPAAAAILAGLDPHVTGGAVLEVPDERDRLPLPGPAGMEVRYVMRSGVHDRPGEAALLAAGADPAPPSTAVYCWSAGEAALAAGMRRHWAALGVPKDRICFCGYWRAAQHRAPGLL